MAHCITRGAKLTYQQMGEGPDLVLVHGLATNRAFWYATLAQAFKNNYRVTLYDLRGHGYSELTEQGYSASAMAQDLEGLLDHLGISQAMVVGHSYGGGVALELAAQQPERVSHLALLDTKVNSLQPQQWLHDSDYLSEFETEIADAAGLDWENEPQLGLTYLETVARLRVAGYQAKARDSFTPFAEGGGGLRAAKHYLKLLDTTHAQQEFLEKGVSAEKLAALRMPLLFMYGANSRCLPSGRALKELLPNAGLRIITDAGHFFAASHADEVVETLINFFALETTTTTLT